MLADASEQESKSVTLEMARSTSPAPRAEANQVASIAENYLNTSTIGRSQGLVFVDTAQAQVVDTKTLGLTFDRQRIVPDLNHINMYLDKIIASCYSKESHKDTLDYSKIYHWLGKSLADLKNSEHLYLCEFDYGPRAIVRNFCKYSRCMWLSGALARECSNKLTYDMPFRLQRIFFNLGETFDVWDPKNDCMYLYIDAATIKKALIDDIGIEYRYLNSNTLVFANKEDLMMATLLKKEPSNFLAISLGDLRVNFLKSKISKNMSTDQITEVATAFHSYKTTVNRFIT